MPYNQWDSGNSYSHLDHLISAISDRISAPFPATIRLHAKGLTGALRLAIWRVLRPAQTSHFAASAQVSPVESFL